MVSDYMYDYLTCTSNQAALRPCVMVTAGVCSPELCRYRRDFEPLWHTCCRVSFETRLLSAVKLTQHVRTRCGSSLSPLIDIVQPSPAAGRGWHVLHTTTTCAAISAYDDGSAPATHA